MKTILEILRLLFSFFVKVQEQKPEPTPLPVPAPLPVTAPIPEPKPTPVPSAEHGPYNPGEYYEFPATGKTAYEGTITFDLKGLNGSSFPNGPNENGFLFMLMGRTHRNTEANLQFHIYNNEGRDAQVRLISQRFGDAACLREGHTHCESADAIMQHQDEAVNFDPDKEYHVTISWNTRSATMIIKQDNYHDLIWSGQNETRTWGGYKSIDWIRVGNAVFPGKGGQNAPLTVINPVLVLN